MAAEVNWKELLQKNEGSKEEVAQAYIGTLLQMGFEVHEKSLLGPRMHGTTSAVLQHLYNRRFSDLYLAKSDW